MPRAQASRRGLSRQISADLRRYPAYQRRFAAAPRPDDQKVLIRRTGVLAENLQDQLEMVVSDGETLDQFRPVGNENTRPGAPVKTSEPKVLFSNYFYFSFNYI